MATRRGFVGGNWKSNGTKESVNTLAGGLAKATIPDSIDVVVAPTFLHIGAVKGLLEGSVVSVAGQDCGDHGAGAFTSSITAEMLKDFGLEWVILGHSEVLFFVFVFVFFGFFFSSSLFHFHFLFSPSPQYFLNYFALLTIIFFFFQRRSVFGDNDEKIAAKTTKALDAGLNVIACIGEKLDEREAGKALDVVLGQGFFFFFFFFFFSVFFFFFFFPLVFIISPFLSFLSVKVIAGAVKDWSKVVLAYEPVWAIGTGFFFLSLFPFLPPFFLFLSFPSFLSLFYSIKARLLPLLMPKLSTSPSEDG